MNRYEYPDLNGKTIRRFRYFNEIDYRCIEIDFEDDSLLTFRLELTQRAEFGVMDDGNLTGVRILTPIKQAT
jgi:hypothetical protein